MNVHQERYLARLRERPGEWVTLWEGTYGLVDKRRQMQRAANIADGMVILGTRFNLKLEAVIEEDDEGVTVLACLTP